MFLSLGCPLASSGVLCLLAQSCPTLYNPMDCSLPGFLSMGILQATILERVAMPSSRGSSQPRNRAQVYHIAGGFFTDLATGKPIFCRALKKKTSITLYSPNKRINFIFILVRLSSISSLLKLINSSLTIYSLIRQKKMAGKTLYYLISRCTQLLIILKSGALFCLRPPGTCLVNPRIVICNVGCEYKVSIQCSCRCPLTGSVIQVTAVVAHTSL